jgi:hypothetical protein
MWPRLPRASRSRPHSSGSACRSTQVSDAWSLRAASDTGRGPASTRFMRPSTMGTASVNIPTSRIASTNNPQRRTRFMTRGYRGKPQRVTSPLKPNRQHIRLNEYSFSH